MKVRTHTSAYRRSCVVTIDNMKMKLEFHSGGMQARNSLIYTSATVWAEGLPAGLIGLRRDGIANFGYHDFPNLFSSMPDKGMMKLKAMAMAQRLPKFPFSTQMTVQAYIDLVANTKIDVARWAKAIKGEL